MRAAALVLAMLACRSYSAGQDSSKPTLPSATLTSEEQTIFDSTNEARKKMDLAPLTLAPKLIDAARGHSKNMAKQEKMAHELDGKTPVDRVKSAGYDYSRMGENVAYGEGTFDVGQIFDGWMKSPGHRANILNPDFTEIGIAAAVSQNGKRYYTQVFGTPRRP